MVKDRDKIRVLQLFPTKEYNVYAPYLEKGDTQGVFVFAFATQKRLPTKLYIKAVHKDSVEEIELEYMHHCIYKGIVKEVGIFYFAVDNRQRLCLQDHNTKLSVLVPINEELFEIVCRDYQFFFVGE